jgi:type III secretory pathway component EscS
MLLLLVSHHSAAAAQTVGTIVAARQAAATEFKAQTSPTSMHVMAKSFPDRLLVLKNTILGTPMS